MIEILDYNEFEEGSYHEIAKLRREYLYKVLTDKNRNPFYTDSKIQKIKKRYENKIRYVDGFYYSNK